VDDLMTLDQLHALLARLLDEGVPGTTPVKVSLKTDAGVGPWSGVAVHSNPFAKDVWIEASRG
jgi:hypothetical protein